MKLSLVDLRVWGLFLVFGLAVALWAASVETRAAHDRIESLGRELTTIREARDAATDQRDAARRGQTAAETRLTEYAAEAAVSFQAQADASARLAAEITTLNRRLDAARKEIDRADAGLRLDDPLPRGVRDGLACAGGDAAACADPGPADSSRLPAGPADQAGPAGLSAGDDDRA